MTEVLIYFCLYCEVCHCLFTFNALLVTTSITKKFVILLSEMTNDNIDQELSLDELNNVSGGFNIFKWIAKFIDKDHGYGNQPSKSSVKEDENGKGCTDRISPL